MFDISPDTAKSAIDEAGKVLDPRIENLINQFKAIVETYADGYEVVVQLRKKQ
jgi:hypothetical protein